MFDDLLAIFEFPASADGAVSTKSVAANARTKSIEAEVNPVEGSHPNGEFLLVLSSDHLDRDGERLFAYEWMHPLPPKLHFDSDHGFAKGMSVPLTTGSGVPSIDEDGNLIVKGTYAGTEHGQLTRQLVNEGHIWGASVAYQTHVMDDGSIVRELLNGTFTGVPANPQAVVLSSKAARSVDGASVDGASVDLVQALHDVAHAAIAKRTGKSGKSLRCRCNTKCSSAAVLAGARARRFNVDQKIRLAVVEAEGRLVGSGDLRQAGAKGSGRERLRRFEQQSSGLARAEARLRKFALDSRLSENP
jgi:hypothetical protein